MQNSHFERLKMGFQSEKSLIRNYNEQVIAAPVDAIQSVLAECVAPDWKWMGFHPFNDLNGAEAVAQGFWQGFKQAFSSLTRREDIFFAGVSAVDDASAVWVVSMGHLVGLFDEPWLGIRPTGKLAFLRYCEFHQVQNHQITQTAFYFDIPHLMRQVGQNPFPPQTGFHLVQPGPQTHDGLLYDEQDQALGKKTLEVIESMIGNLGRWNSGLALEDELALNWDPRMYWWGPEGVGSTYTIERYAKQHSGPFRAAFAERSKTTHRARIAEGHYGGFFGRPNFTAVHKGGFMGLPGNPTPCEFRVIDIYRRSGNKLAENWVFIDILHWLYQQGDDVLGRMNLYLPMR